MPEKILVVIDEIELKYFEFNDLVTNFWLIKEFLDRNYDVSITTKNKLFIKNSLGHTLYFDTFEKNSNIFYEKQEKSSKINDFDVVFFRPDPPVDIDYIDACNVFDFVDKNKTIVINNPQSIKNFNEKTHANYFPNYMPANIVTSSKAQIIEFVQEQKEAIIKPLNRCFGSGVFYLNREDRNLNSIISTATNNEKTMVMVQKYIDKAQFGDKRILIVGEKAYDECIVKLPGKDDFKFNTHNDQFFAPASLNKEEKEMASDVAKILNSHELYMAGLDVIDGQIIEINITSPCFFFREINKNYKINFEKTVIEDLISLMSKKEIKI